jgi:hypothetical protein
MSLCEKLANCQYLSFINKTLCKDDVGLRKPFFRKRNGVIEEWTQTKIFKVFPETRQL